MPELKKGFTEVGFTEVTTYHNSGNIVFSSAIEDKNTLTNYGENNV
jgi:uncharacterized protein (DUF1697 family)